MQQAASLTTRGGGKTESQGKNKESLLERRFTKQRADDGSRKTELASVQINHEKRVRERSKA